MPLNTKTVSVTAFVVAGGGAGGNYGSSANSGGGGGGGVVTQILTVPKYQPYTITVGAGGSSFNFNYDYAQGGDSSVFTLTAFGGGYGGANMYGPGNGGSGGGGNGNGGYTGALGTLNQGFSGGQGSIWSAGGGGGAGGIGMFGTATNGGSGGSGILSYITGTPVYYAGGGGGGNYNAATTIASGGIGGGGNGGYTAYNLGATSGTNGLGGGGGAGHDGGSGVVILAIPTTQFYSDGVTGSPSISVNGPNTILIYTSGGSVTFLDRGYVLPLSANAGVLYAQQGFDINKDIVVSFDYACYGNGTQGSEGFSVFFTSTLSGVSGGGPGPGLCYSPLIAASATNTVGITSYPGVQYGALGIGFDITGNFGSNLFNNPDGLDIPVTNSITIRDSFDNNYKFLYNSGDLAGGNFPFNHTLYQPISSLSDTSTVVYNRARVRITDFGQRVVIDIKRPTDTNFSNFVNYILPTSAWWPDTVYCCLGFATGPDITELKIKNFNVNGVFNNDPRTWLYGLDATTFNNSLFTFTTGVTSISAFLNIGETIDIINQPPYNTGMYLSSPLININYGGTAGLQSGDNYILIQ
jgi:hypothetical protein